MFGFLRNKERSTQELSESELIEACKKGSSKAQKQLYEQHSSKMFGVALRYVGNHHEAEDVLVTAFMKVFEHLDSFKSEGSFEGWIRRIVSNEALGLIRKRKKVFMEEIENADYKGKNNPASTTLETNDLLALVKQLPDGYRTVFNMYAIEGFSHKEIAEKMGISENTSKSQLSRARALLKKWLTQIDDNANNTTQNNQSMQSFVL
ncbi:RNA polymerase sigma factor, sigma-70 family [Bernardetia litoralis DSM 6794]|uniref:RNA polymerase sigma factor, sigma-70 family n=1 Tax=Bernardetia litoralis (strain ATCC 23117 / DSM 6794 / NBRC 15988 / NCIMB 1366 / Fx l1 / Sio-4) TaxID=880071 RepID=I4ALR6_BERLS|nr:RNA polymerase sigma factor [Bernardetia litoralis]AFM04901.1 RNA polymerase sigma factor, sigma-70 family [Bernardetia litoralis DSM 6794]